MGNSERFHKEDSDMIDNKKSVKIDLNNCLAYNNEFSFSIIYDGETYFDAEVATILDEYPNLQNEIVQLNNDIYNLRDEIIKAINEIYRKTDKIEILENHPFKNLFNFIVNKFRKRRGKEDE